MEAVPWVIAAAILPYLLTLRAGFLLDDLPLIVDNPLLKSWASLPKLLTTGLWIGAYGPSMPNPAFRPLTSLLYFLEYRAFGSHAGAYHLIGVLLHAACAALLYKVLRRETTERFSLVTALAFAVLPIHVDAVASVVSQNEAFALLLMLGAWWFLAEESPTERTLNAGLACAAAAFFAKENTLVFPAVFALADWSLHGRRPDDPRRRDVYIGLLAGLVAFFAVRYQAVGNRFDLGELYFAGVPLAQKLVTLSVFWLRYYAAPLLTGAFQTVDMSKPLVPLLPALHVGGLLALTAWTTALLLALYDLAVRRAAWAMLVLVAVLFLLPTSNVLNQTNTIGAERFLYIPSLAWCAALGWAAERWSGRRAALASLGALLAWYAAKTAERSLLWQDELSFYSASVRENPASPETRYSLGVALIHAGRAKEGEEELKKAVALGPLDAGAYYNLGRLAFDRGDLKEAEKEFLAAARLRPQDADTWTALGIIAEQQGRAGEAEDRYRKALSVRPWDERAKGALDRLLAGRKRRLP